MVDDNSVIVKFGANIDDIKSKMGELGGVIGNIVDKFVGLAAIAAGGAAFKAFIDETVKLNTEALQLSKTLGITGEEAGTLNTALGDIGSDADTYSAAFLKFTRAIRNNGDELKALGVDVDAVASGQKTSNEVFVESLGLFQQYKPGIDQSEFALTVFGRSVADVQKLQKLFGTDTERTITTINDQGQAVTHVLTPLEAYNLKLEEARKKNEDLNLTISQDSLDAVKKYKLAMNDVRDVLSGIEKTIGDAVIPIFTALSQSFADAGPSIIAVMLPVADTIGVVLDQIVKSLQTMWDMAVSVARAVGSAFSALGELFGVDVPDAMQVFRNALAIVQAGFVAFRVVLETGAEGVSIAFDVLGASMRGFAAVADRVFHLDAAGAVAAYKGAVNEIAGIVQLGVKRIGAINAQGDKDLEKALMSGYDQKAGAKAADKVPGGGGKTFTRPDDALGKARLALQKANDDAALALQLEFLKQAGADYEDAYKNDLITTREYYDAKLAIQTKALDLTIETKQREADAVAKQAGAPGLKDAQKVQFAAQEAKLLGEINVLEAQRTGLVQTNAAAYANAERQRMDAITSIRINMAKSAADSELQLEGQAIAQRRALLQTSAEQEINERAALERRQYEVEKAALTERLALAHDDMVKRLEIAAQLEALEQQHQQRITALANEGTRERSKYVLQANTDIKQNFTNFLNDLMSGTKKISTAFHDFALGVATSIQRLIAQKLSDKLFDSLGGNKVVQMLVKPFDMAIDWIVGLWAQKEAVQTAATAAGTAERTAIEGAAEEESLLMSAASAVKRIAMAAWEAAASVYASIAAIPYVGPFLAPAMAIAAGALVLGFAKNISSAEGGWWQIPGDQIAQVHANEMVLPAAEAQGIRDVVTNANTNGRQMTAAHGGGGDTYVVHATDAKSFKRLLMDNAPAVGEAVRQHARNGGIGPKA
jgi:hypothetical protein